MATNDFLSFATAFGANVESQADYAADTARTLGQQPGVAKSALNNKALRQATFMVAALAQYMSNTTGNDVLDNATQADILATMALTWPGNTLPTLTKLTTTGSTTGYVFTCTSANATVGATYTNNGNTYTVLATLASGTLLFCSGASAPLSSGTLTKSAGTGDSTITFSTRQALATYTTPANTRWLKIKGVGGGSGAGGGADTQGDTTNGSDGTLTAFGPSLLLALGAKGAQGSAGGIGGTASLGTGPVGVAFQGAGGGSSGSDATGGHGIPGCAGNSPFGGGGSGVAPGGTGAAVAAQNAAANSGSGGTGGSSNASTSSYGGGGGSAGGYFDAIITTPAASYVYAIGAGGAGGAAGASGGAGGAGGSGILLIEEHYS